MSENPGHVINQGFPCSFKRWGENSSPPRLVEGEWELLLRLDIFISFWASEEESISL